MLGSNERRVDDKVNPPRKPYLVKLLEKGAAKLDAALALELVLVRVEDAALCHLQTRRRERTLREQVYELRVLVPLVGVLEARRMCTVRLCSVV